jgi:hypothetical protein
MTTSKKPSIKKVLLTIGVLSILGVIFYNTKDLILGAPLSITTAVDGASISSAYLPISGTAKHASTLQINGRTVAMDKSGAFSDGALLSPGYNIVEISQVDRFGKEKRKIIHLVAQPSASVATAMNIHYQ